MGMHNDLLVQFEESLQGGQAADHKNLLKRLRAAPPALLEALADFAWEAGYAEAQGAFGIAPVQTPSSEDVSRARTRAGLSRKEAAQLIHYSEQAWSLWELGQSKMPSHAWELFCIKVSDRFDPVPGAESDPSPDAIRGHRASAGMTLAAAAKTVHCTISAWQHWENGNRKMRRSIWELFLIKVSVPDLI